MENGKLGNEQRKALEKLVQNASNRRIQELRDVYNDAVERATKEVRDETGITAIDEELKNLKQRIFDLECEKERLGIGKYNDSFLSGSKSKDIIDERTANEKQAIRESELQMDKTITAIWTANDISEIKGMLGEILK